MTTPTDHTAESPRRPLPEDDARFTAGLVFDIADVLTKAGYPPAAGWTGRQWVDLQQAVFQFLYRSGDPIGIPAPDPVAWRGRRRAGGR